MGGSAEDPSFPPNCGLEAADEAFSVVRAGTSKLVQLLADELVPLGSGTVDELTGTVDRIRAALPALAHWQAEQGSTGEWSLEPPFSQVAVHLSSPSDMDDFENVERLRRSFELLAPRSLALRKEAAQLVVDALLRQLRR